MKQTVPFSNSAIGRLRGVPRAVLLLAAFLLVNGVLGLAMRDSFSTAPATVATPQNAEQIRQEAGQLRRKGQFAAAAELLRGATADAACRHDLLSVLEDDGQVDALITESRTYLANDPADDECRVALARGLLFKAALVPATAAELADEAEALASVLEAHHFSNQQSPGAVTIGRHQVAMVRKQWPLAQRLATQALVQGTTPGETADLRAVCFDLALRAGRLDEARRQLDLAEQTMAGWKQEYYQLYPYREIAMMARLAWFGTPFTRQEIDVIDAAHDDLKEKGMVERLAAFDTSRELLLGMHDKMREFVVMRSRGDVQGQLGLVDFSLRAWSLPHRPICFYAEASYHRLLMATFRVYAGDLCRDAGRIDEARAHYRAGLREHEGNRLLQQRLAALRP